MSQILVARKAASYRATATGGGGSSLPMDSWLTNLYAIVGLKRYLSAYTGPLIRVRRSNDNAEQDIGYGVTNLLDTTALASFVGSNSAYVTKFYDQKGSRDLAQTTNSLQGRIVNAGTLETSTIGGGRPCVRFLSASLHCYTTVAMPGTNTGATLFLDACVNAWGTAGEYNVLFESGVAADNGFGIFHNGTEETVNFYSHAAAGNNFAIYGDGTGNDGKPFGQVNAYVIDRTALTASEINKWYRGGTLQTPSEGYEQVLQGGGPMGTTPISIGARDNGASLGTNMELMGFAWYIDVKFGTDVGLITTAMST